MRKTIRKIALSLAGTAVAMSVLSGLNAIATAPQKVIIASISTCVRPSITTTAGLPSGTITIHK